MSDVEEDIDPNGNFAYDVAVCYEDDNDDEEKTEIQGVVDKLEQDDWGFLVYDSHRDGEGSQVKRLEKSVDDCRHLIVFLSLKLLEAIKRNEEAPAVTNFETFLCNILHNRDTRLKRKLIVVRLGTECQDCNIPTILKNCRILNIREKGFYRQLYKAVSKLPGAQTIEEIQIRRKVDQMARGGCCTEAVLMKVAKELGIPQDVLCSIMQEFGGYRAQLVEVLVVWRVHRGPEATLVVADDAIRKATNTTPQQVEAGPQSLGAFFSGSDVDGATNCMENLNMATPPPTDDTVDETVEEEERQLSSLPSVPTHAIDEKQKLRSVAQAIPRYYRYPAEEKIGQALDYKINARRYFDFIKENASTDWRNLASYLGVGWADIKRIEVRKPDDKSRCMDMLEQWRRRNGNGATVEVLMRALFKAGQNDTLEGLQYEYPELRRVVLTTFTGYREPIEKAEGLSSTTIDFQHPEMAMLYGKARRRRHDGSQPVFSLQVPVAGQIGSGKTCFINRLVGETPRQDKPIADEIPIVSDASLPYRRMYKSPEEAFGRRSVIPGGVKGASKSMPGTGFMKDELGTAKYPRLTFLELGSEATYGMHPRNTHRGVCILVMSLLQKLDPPSYLSKASRKKEILP
uniref:Death domain-containing protein n=1 Tax=Branchiostoma floridae TaxID=7739 RepID=C3ZSU1_BRAFL|eukprot:XP_002588482.1 hypothetical protein BRAFLDRAFT_63430 [Branchiostoma floridae]